MEGKWHSKPLSNQDTILILFALSSIFGLLNYRMTLSEPQVSLMGGLMSLIFVGFWVYASFAAGMKRNRGFIVGAGVIWGMSMIFVIWNMFDMAGLKNAQPGGFTSVLAAAALVFNLFATATIVPQYQGLANLGYYMSTPLSLLIVCCASIAVIAVLYLAGMSFGKKREKEYLERRKNVLKKNLR